MPTLPGQQRPLENRLLAALPKEVYEQLVPSLEPVSLTLKQPLYEPNRALASVYFPLTMVGSLLTLMQDGQQIEVSTVGNEGMIGLPVFWGAETISGLAVTQVPGEAMHMPAALFRDHALQRGPLQACCYFTHKPCSRKWRNRWPVTACIPSSSAALAGC